MTIFIIIIIVLFVVVELKLLAGKMLPILIKLNLIVITYMRQIAVNGCRCCCLYYSC